MGCPFSRINKQYELHTQYYDQLLCPTSGLVEPMFLQLYAVEIQDYALTKRRLKKPVGRFFRSENGAEVEEKYWTSEMREVYDTAIKGNPVKDSYCKLTLWGKCVIITLCVALLALGYFAMTWDNTSASPSDTIPTVPDSLAPRTL